MLDDCIILYYIYYISQDRGLFVIFAPHVFPVTQFPLSDCVHVIQVSHHLA